MNSRIPSDSDEELDTAVRSAFADIIDATENPHRTRIADDRDERAGRLTGRRWLSVAAAALLLVGGAGLVLVSQREASDDAASVADDKAPAPTAEPINDSSVDTLDDEGPLVATSLPEDLIFRGLTTTPSPSKEIAPLVFMWSPTATIKFDVGDPAFAADVERPGDVEEAIQTPRTVEPGFVGLDWINADGDILVVVAEGASLDVVAPLARRFDELRSTTRPLDLLEPPEGFEVFDPASLPPTVEYRWTSDDQSRGILVLTESTFPLATRAELRSGSTRIERSSTTFTLVNTFGLSENERADVERSLTSATQSNLPTPVPEATSFAAPNADTQTFASDASDERVWTIQGRLAGKDTPVSGIAEVSDEQRSYHLDPFEQLIDPSIYPVQDRGVLVAYTADGVHSVLIEWLDDSGAVLQSIRSDDHLAGMVSADYPPLIAATVPTEARALRLTPESEDQQAMSAPITITNLTPDNPPG